MKPAFLSPEICEALERVQARPGADLSRFPDFLVLGPQRTGTSWLNSHLKVHPEIFLPKGKETYFFNTLQRPDSPKFAFPWLEDYTNIAMTDSAPQRWRKRIRSRFVHGTRYEPKFVGDATASYASLDPETIAEICMINPEMKGILMMREPAERIWSHAKKKYTQHTGFSMEEMDQEELDRFFRASGQQRRSFYSTMIDHWREHLEPGNLFVAEFRLIKEEPGRLLTEVLSFVGAESEEFPLQCNLDEKVYATGRSRMPSDVGERIAERFAEASEDYRNVLANLIEDQVSSGIYRI